MKKKLLVLLIAVIPTLMPNLVFAVAIDVGDCVGGYIVADGQSICVDDILYDANPFSPLAQ